MMPLAGMINPLGRARTAALPSFRLTCTTTGAATLRMERVTPTGGTCVIDWGDGSAQSVIAANNASATTHAYAGAGTWAVKIYNPERITGLDLRDAKLSGVVNAANPLPAGLTYLRLQEMGGLTYNVNASPLPAGLTTLYLIAWGLTYNVNTNPLPAGLTTLELFYVPGLTYNVNANPLPAGLTYLRLYNLSGLTYNVNANPLPAGLTYLHLQTLSSLTWIIRADAPWPIGDTTAEVTDVRNVTVTAWTNNAVKSIRLENFYSEAAVDAVINAVWENKANFTWPTPTLDLLGVGNAAPSGVYQAASPPTTGREKIFDLVNGSYTPAGPEWTVQYQA